MSPRIPGNGSDTASCFEHVSKMLNPLIKAAWCVDHCVLILTSFSMLNTMNHKSLHLRAHLNWANVHCGWLDFLMLQQVLT